eukprot:759697-Hanusia_phi.AAC.6
MRKVPRVTVYSDYAQHSIVSGSLSRSLEVGAMEQVVVGSSRVQSAHKVDVCQKNLNVTGEIVSQERAQTSFPCFLVVHRICLLSERLRADLYWRFFPGAEAATF